MARMRQVDAKFIQDPGPAWSASGSGACDPLRDPRVGAIGRAVNRLRGWARAHAKHGRVLALVAVSACGGGGGDNAGTAPAGLFYPSPQIYTVGQAIAALTPAVIGSVTSYSVAPALPPGLTLNPASGVISGTPNTPAALAGYVVSARNDAGSTSFSLSINVLTNNPTEMRLHPDGRIARLVTPLATSWTIAAAPANARQTASTLYGHFRDDFDFIFLIGTAQAGSAVNYEGIHIQARNEVQGIGKAIADTTAQFGSVGRLRSVISLNRRNGLRNGPSLHELLHAWANDAIATGLASHWNFSGSGGGQLGGFDPRTLTNLGSGRYQANNGRPGATGFGLNANGGNTVPYSDIELYLMGMRAAAGTPDVAVADNPAAVDLANGIFSATGFTTHTIDSVVARLGARVPAFDVSPKNFKVLVVVLAAAELGDAEFDALDDDVRLFGLPGDDGRPGEFNFWEATRGVGTLTVDGLAGSLR